jgi:hypothetical protein
MIKDQKVSTNDSALEFIRQKCEDPGSSLRTVFELKGKFVCLARGKLAMLFNQSYLNVMILTLLSGKESGFKILTIARITTKRRMYQGLEAPKARATHRQVVH